MPTLRNVIYPERLRADADKSAAAVLALGLRSIYARDAWLRRMEVLGWTFKPTRGHARMIIDIRGRPDRPEIKLSHCDISHIDDDRV